MALVNCEECEKEISSRAASCPHCGCPITGIALNDQETPESKEGCFLQTLNIGCMVFSGLVVFAIFAYVVGLS